MQASDASGMVFEGAWMGSTPTKTPGDERELGTILGHETSRAMARRTRQKWM
ncbi:hypothetical protein TRAPUB_3336 [Trametes pubescens]|uniref:Uncharacterized protein n=1 Tax=Trametes pubescens TaxID=154538 RepID=A0A1M2VDX9_TRAPU|nr:hypothetical protein TRAPUB_3336 [Trametes pubescens]